MKSRFIPLDNKLCYSPQQRAIFTQWIDKIRISWSNFSLCCIKYGYSYIY